MAQTIAPTTEVDINGYTATMPPLGQQSMFSLMRTRIRRALNIGDKEKLDSDVDDTSDVDETDDDREDEQEERFVKNDNDRLTNKQATREIMKEFKDGFNGFWGNNNAMVQRVGTRGNVPRYKGWRGPNPVLFTFLACVQRDTSIASLLRAIHPALNEICRVLGESWQSNIKHTHEAWVPAMRHRWRSRCKIEFPTSQNLNINMMPIVLGDLSSLPASCRQYSAMIQHCCGRLPKEEMGKIGYLTVSETDVAAGTTHRREGLHTETPGSLLIPGKFELNEQEHGWSKDLVRRVVNWGSGAIEVGAFKGGIFTANTVDNSLEVWNAQVMNAHDMVGQGGYCEHLRDMIGTGTTIAANVMVWMTDTTPHESLPLKQSQHRQFFRLVTSDVSVWYSQHSDENPLGIKADPNTTITLNNNKFETSKQPSL